MAICRDYQRGKSSNFMHPIIPDRMKTDRRKFLAAASGLAFAGVFPSSASAGGHTSVGEDRLDPWIEVLPAAIISNVQTLHRLSGRPVIAVVKNNGYGLGVDTVAKILEPRAEVAGF